jgi:hypothetical protein
MAHLTLRAGNRRAFDYLVPELSIRPPTVVLTTRAVNLTTDHQIDVDLIASRRFDVDLIASRRFDVDLIANRQFDN